MRVRKKPVEVDAMQFVEESGSPEEIATWCGGRVRNNLGHQSGKVALVIPTLEGEMTAQYGDWIIKGVQGEFYPIKDAIFRATYETVTTGPSA
jgi:hypothetical protein